MDPTQPLGLTPPAASPYATAAPPSALTPQQMQIIAALKAGTTGMGGGGQDPSQSGAAPGASPSINQSYNKFGTQLGTALGGGLKNMFGGAGGQGAGASPGMPGAPASPMMMPGNPSDPSSMAAALDPSSNPFNSLGGLW